MDTAEVEERLKELKTQLLNIKSKIDSTALSIKNIDIDLRDLRKAVYITKQNIASDSISMEEERGYNSDILPAKIDIPVSSEKIAGESKISKEKKPVFSGLFIKKLQEIVRHYNDALDDTDIINKNFTGMSAKRREFMEQYKAVKVNNIDKEARMPYFKSNDDGSFMVFLVEGYKVYAIVPIFSFELNGKSYTESNFEEIYDCPNFNSKLNYPQNKIIQPALADFNSDSGIWQIKHKGELSLISAQQSYTNNIHSREKDAILRASVIASFFNPSVLGGSDGIAPTITFSESQIEFATDSIELLHQTRKQLDEIGIAFKNPKLAGINFLIAGHTDERQSKHFKDNQELSLRRAETVKDYLIKNHGISAESLYIKGYGSTRPIASGSDEASWALNRRLEIRKLGATDRIFQHFKPERVGVINYEEIKSSSKKLGEVLSEVQITQKGVKDQKSIFDSELAGTEAKNGEEAKTKEKDGLETLTLKAELCILYNEAVDIPEKQKDFRRLYHPEMLTVKNTMERKDDSSIEPIFQKDKNGAYFIIRINSDNYVVPKFNLNLNYNIHGPSAIGFVFEYKQGFDPRMTYRKLKVREPAVFKHESKGDRWFLDKRGKLDLGIGR